MHRTCGFQQLEGQYVRRRLLQIATKQDLFGAVRALYSGHHEERAARQSNNRTVADLPVWHSTQGFGVAITAPKRAASFTLSRNSSGADLLSNITRRAFLGSVSAAFATTGAAQAHKQIQAKIADQFLPQLVNTGRSDWVAGSVHVVPDDYFLFFMLDDGLAIRYGVGVGRKDLYEPGTFTVARKAEWPWWRPTNAMIRREPNKYAKFKNGLKGGPNNPLGARALYLYDDDGKDTYLRIHGTNSPGTIGSAVSNGCARLTNEHVKDLYERVAIGALVHLYPKTAKA